MVTVIAHPDRSDLGVLLAVIVVSLGVSKRVLCEVCHCQLTFQVCYAGIQLNYEGIFGAMLTFQRLNGFIFTGYDTIFASYDAIFVCYTVAKFADQL